MEANTKQYQSSKNVQSRLWKTKKFRQVLITSVWGFVITAERAIIIPTLWLYLKETWGNKEAEKYYPFSMAGFSLMIILATPACSYFADRGVSTKLLIIISNQFEILGNLIYLFAPHPSVVLLGRLIAGMGGGCEAPLYADLTKLTTHQERTPYTVISMLARQFGLIFGPVFTLVLKSMTISSEKMVISVYNGPGLVMAISWTLITIITFILYPKIEQQENEFCKNTNSKTSTLPFSDYEENLLEIKSKYQQFSQFIHPYKKYNVCSILLMAFGSCFTLMSFETVLSPLLDRIYKYTEVEVSYIYLTASFVVIITFGVLHYLTTKCSDWCLIVIGGTLITLSYMSMIFVSAFTHLMSAKLSIVLLMTVGVLHVIGLPFSITCSTSLYSKLISSDFQKSQSVFRIMENIASLAGLLFGGLLVNYSYCLFIIMFFLILFPLGMIMMHPKRFLARDNEELKTNYTEDSHNKHIYLQRF